MDFNLKIKGENGHPDVERTFKIDMVQNASTEEVADMGRKLWDLLENQVMYSLHLAYATKTFLDGAEDLIKTKILVVGKPGPSLRCLTDGIQMLRKRLKKFEGKLSKSGVPAEQLYKDLKNIIKTREKEQ